MAKRQAHYQGQVVENYPLHWPMGRERTPADDRKRAKFGRKGDSGYGSWQCKKSLTISQALDRLMSQIMAFTRHGHAWRIHPDHVVVSTDVRTRNDGLPYSNAREPDDSGVAVYFELDGEPHCLPCDAWDRVADNIAAIAAHLEAMRGMERWGVGDLKTVFAGFKALPSSTAITTMNRRQAAEWLARQAGIRDVAFESDQAVDVAYKRAAMNLHPDRGGNAEDFALLQKVVEQLKGGGS